MKRRKVFPPTFARDPQLVNIFQPAPDLRGLNAFLSSKAFQSKARNPLPSNQFLTNFYLPLVDDDPPFPAQSGLFIVLKNHHSCKDGWEHRTRWREYWRENALAFATMNQVVLQNGILLFHFEIFLLAMYPPHKSVHIPGVYESKNYGSTASYRAGQEGTDGRTMKRTSIPTRFQE